MWQQAVSRNAIILGLFAVTTAALLALTNTFTLDRIQCNRQLALENSLTDVFPPSLSDDNLSAEYALVSDPLLGPGEHRVYRAWQAGTPTGVVLDIIAPDGYGGAIDLLVGVTHQGEITGVRVVPPHRETPGLGDKIELRKSDWILSFNGRSLQNTADPAWAVKTDGGTFDAFTGATITPRAVVGAVHRALHYYQENHESLFAAPAATQMTESCDG